MHDDQAPDNVPALLVNPGGPGGSGLALPIQLAPAISDDVLMHYDLVGFDPRGVGVSNPIQCVSDAQKDKLTALDPDIRTPAGFAIAKAAADEVATACSAKYGAALADYNTVFTAMDMDKIRAAMGDAQLNYLGFSYGTELGGVYAHLYPSKIRVAVLDGAVDPTLDSITGFATQVAGFESAFDQFAADCKTKSPCKSIGDPRTVVENLAAQANITPIKSSRAGETRTADGAIVLLGVLSALYDQSEWPTLGAAIIQAQAGDSKGLFALADEYSDRNDDGTYYDNIFDANTAISCNDSAPGPTDAVISATAADWATKYPMFGLWQARLALQLPGLAADPAHPTLAGGDRISAHPGGRHDPRSGDALHRRPASDERPDHRSPAHLGRPGPHRLSQGQRLHRRRR